MIRVLNSLPPLQTSLQSLLQSGGGARAATPADVDGLVRALRRKASFAEIHSKFFDGIEWDRIDGIGRCSAGATEPERFWVPLKEASLRFDHPGALIDHVYLAFDGLTAALVNMTDTLGRLLNLVYGLQIDPKRASLLSVRDKCAVTSPLGYVLSDAKQTDWLKRVRDLRGRCQHADVEEVLALGGGTYARRGQPYVDQAYCWKSPAQPTLIVTYAQDATQAAADCLYAAMTAILKAPHNPTI